MLTLDVQCPICLQTDFKHVIPLFYQGDGVDIFRCQNCDTIIQGKTETLQPYIEDSNND